MHIFFSVALGLGAIEKSMIILTGLGFLIMFGYSSAKGNYQDLIKSTLNNDEIRRKKNSPKNK